MFEELTEINEITLAQAVMEEALNIHICSKQRAPGALWGLGLRLISFKR